MEPKDIESRDELDYYPYLISSYVVARVLALTQTELLQDLLYSHEDETTILSSISIFNFMSTVYDVICLHHRAIADARAHAQSSAH